MFPKAENMLVLDSVDSTNNYAMAMIQQGLAKDGHAVFAMEQTDGRGRRGRQWTSNKGDNIILSISKQMQWMPVSQQFHLSVAVALGCFDLASKYVPGIVSIKWPNDIFINDTKAGGILIDNTIKGTLWQWAVIGIGLNVNQEDFDAANLNATSLSVATKNTYEVLILAKELYLFVLNRINELKAGNFSNLLEIYNQYLFGKGRIVKLKKLDEIFESKIIGVSDSGQLITRDKMERKFNFDEVEFKGLV